VDDYFINDIVNGLVTLVPNIHVKLY